MAGGECRFGLEPYHFAQAAFDAIALHGIADLLGHREADTDRTTILSGILTGFATPQPLEHKRIGRRPRASLGSSPKVRPAFQALHGIRFGFGLVRVRHARGLHRSGDKTLLTRSAAAFSLGAQSFAAAGAARGHNLLAAPGRHPGAKAVTALAHQFARLIGPFHGVISAAHAKF
jgi:hypothetical protein